MFDGPEYASYIALCRELRLERKQPANGDVFWSGEYIELIGRTVVDTFFVGQHGGSEGSQWPNDDAIWLPRLDQWLAMLEKAGVEAVTIRLAWTNPADSSEKEFVAFNAWNIPDKNDLSNYRTREEAAARLWKAVVHEIAQREGVTSY